VSTLAQLRQRYPANYITAEQLLADHLPHIKSVRYLRRRIAADNLALPLTRLPPASARSPWIIYLTDLATYLDAQEQADTAARTAA